jgi:signal transduction histidine kinase
MTAAAGKHVDTLGRRLSIRRAVRGSLRTRLFVASVLFALLVLAVFGALILAVFDLRDATDREARAKDRTAATLQLEKLVLDLETGLRGFALASTPLARERLLAPWKHARKELPDQLAAFPALFESGTQKKRALRLTRSIRQYVDDFSVPLVRIARQRPAAVVTSAANDEGRTRIAGIRRQFSAILGDENMAAAESAETAERRAWTAVGATIGGLVVIGMLIVAFGAFLAKSIASPLRDAADGAQRLAAGELETRVPEQGPGEVGELTRAFNAMAARLEENRRELEQQNARLRESERLKSELISIVSHELRTPLASILGFTTLLRERDFDDESRRRYLEIIDDASRRLNTLVNDFLDAQRIDEGRLELTFETLDVQRLLAEQVRLFAGQSDRHNIDLEADVQPLPVRGDRDRLAQVLGNLLSNAIKYSPDGGRVTVEARRRNDHVRIVVGDQGLGIPQDEQPRIFTKFFRGDASKSGIGGSGLGLAVSREIVEAHGGRIGFTSTPGRGSTFWVELPVGSYPDGA